MAQSFEAKLYAMRRNKDGLVVSFVIHPNDITTDILTPDIGTRYMVAVAEIGEDEKPVTELVQGSVPHTDSDTNGKREALESAPDKQRKPFASLPYSQQAALRCQDASFGEYSGSMTPEDCTRYVYATTGATSRADLDKPENADYRKAWEEIEAGYQAWKTDKMFRGAKHA